MVGATTIIELIEGGLNISLDAIESFFGLLGIEGWLIVLTFIVTTVSYRSQKRASIREAIEQIDPRYTEYKELHGHERGNIRSYTRSVQIKAGLNDFDFLRQNSTISFISNRISGESDRVVRHSVPPYYITLPSHGSDQNKTLKTRILSHENIIDVERTEDQLIVRCSTADPVKCRQISNYVLDEHDFTVNNQITREDLRPRFKDR